MAAVKKKARGRSSESDRGSQARDGNAFRDFIALFQMSGSMSTATLSVWSPPPRIKPRRGLTSP
jgi:hypothetical protein